MTIGNIVDLLDPTTKAPLIVQEGESLNIEGSLVDGDGNPILLGGINSFVLYLYDEATNYDVNFTLLGDDILNAGRGTVDANGNFVIRLDGDDTMVMGSLTENEVETHIARLVWTYNDGVGERTGIQEIRHRIQKMTTITNVPL